MRIGLRADRHEEHAGRQLFAGLVNGNSLDLDPRNAVACDARHGLRDEDSLLVEGGADGVED